MKDFDSIVDVGQSGQANPDQPMSFDDIQDHSEPKSFDDIQEDSPTSKYETPGQQVLTGFEGAGQGFAGPLATGLELGAHKIGLDSLAGIDTSAEAIKGRAEANPIIHGVAEAGALAGSMFIGTGEAGLIAAGAEHILPQATGVAAKIGMAAAKGAIEAGLIQGGDEISKAMLGQGNPEAPVSSALVHMGGAALLGGATGGLFNALGQAGSKGIAAIENAKMGDKAKNALIGMGLANKAHAAGIPEKEAKAYICNYFKELGVGAEFDYRPYANGVNMYYGGVKKAVSKATGLAADGAIGYGVGHVFGLNAGILAAGAANKYLSHGVEKILNKPLVYATNRVVIPAVMYALSKGQTYGIFNLLNHTAGVAKGFKAINLGVDSIMKAGGQQSVNAIATERDKKAIMEHVDKGGVQREMQESLQQAPPEDEDEEPQMAEGGEIPEDQQDKGSISSLYPDQDMMLNAARARMSTYLLALKPNQNPQKLPFDKAPDMSEAERTYDNAVSIAAAPLSILNQVKDGSLQAEHVKHFTSMYPELHQYLSKRFTEGILNANMEEFKPTYKTRKALSLFMGTALDSTMTPQAILAAQAVFMPKPAPQQPQDGGKKKDSPAKLGKEAKTYKTTDQAAESDRATRD